MMHLKQNESGRTMLEMLGVLAIMGVIVYGAIAGINFGVEMYKINKTFDQIEDLSQGIVDLYSWQRGYPSSYSAHCGQFQQNDVIDLSGTASGNTCGFTGDLGTITLTPCESGLCEHFGISAETKDEFQCNRLKGMGFSHMKVDDAQSCTGGTTVYLISR